MLISHVKLKILHFFNITTIRAVIAIETLITYLLKFQLYFLLLRGLDELGSNLEYIVEVVFQNYLLRILVKTNFIFNSLRNQSYILSYSKTLQNTVRLVQYKWLWCKILLHLILLYLLNSFFYISGICLNMTQLSDHSSEAKFSLIIFS